MKFSILIISCLISSTLWAAEPMWKQTLRGYIEKYLSVEISTRLLGPAPKENLITLPEIPELSRDAKSVDIYEKNDPILSQGSEFEKLDEKTKSRYNLAFLEELFQVVRTNPAKDEELASFLNVLDQGGTREGVYRKIILDEIYASLEQYEERPSESLINFVYDFGQKYLGRSYSKEGMKEFNLFSLKRILGERSLEILDALAQDGENVYRWYTVFSLDLAETYPGLWSNKVRANQSESFHYNWARSVPFQQIKSEVIIKLNILMNALQAN